MAQNERNVNSQFIHFISFYLILNSLINYTVLCIHQNNMTFNIITPEFKSTDKMWKNTQFIISIDTNSNTFTGWNGLLVRKYQFITNVLQDFLTRSSLLRKTKPNIFVYFQMLNTQHANVGIEK